MENIHNKINLDNLIKTVSLNLHSQVIKDYLGDIFNDINSRSLETSKDSISFFTLQDFLQLPLIISEKICRCLNKEDNGVIKKENFVEGMYNLYFAPFEIRIETAFQLLDFDHDGIINIDDAFLILSHFHFLSNTADVNILSELVDLSFRKAELGYCKMCDYYSPDSGVNCDVLYLLIFMLYKYKPFDEEALRFYGDNVFDPLKIVTLKKPSRKSLFYSNDHINSCIASLNDLNLTTALPNSPYKIQSQGSLTKITARSDSLQFLITAPSEELYNYIHLNYGIDIEYKSESNSMKNLIMSNDELIKLDLDLPEDDVLFIENEIAKEHSIINEGDNITGVIDHLIISSPETDLPRENEEQCINKRGKLQHIFTSHTAHNSENEGFSRSSYDQEKSPKDFLKDPLDQNAQIFSLPNPDASPIVHHTNDCSYNSEYLSINNPVVLTQPYKQEIILFIDKKSILKKYKLVLVNDNIFYYKQSKVTGLYTFKGISILRCIVIEKCTEVTVNDQTFYPFQLITTFNFKNHKVSFLCSSEEDKASFVNSIRKVTNFSRIQEHYDIFGEIGRGQFGKIRLGLHKKTKEKVAVKVLKKSGFKENNLVMIRWELDIFRFLRNISHANIIKPRDYFETATSIYLVYEFVPGGSLSNYLWNRMDKFKSKELKDIIKQLIDAIKFLHRFGVVHRDIKPDNILINQVKSKYGHLGVAIQIKLIDFGLSKVMGKYEKTTESYGSLCYSAPEIFLKQPYDHKVDVWSLGVLIYFLKYTLLPFDDPRGTPEVVIKNIVLKDFKFPNVCDSESTSEEIEFQTLIRNCLQKKGSKRLSIEEISKKYFI